MPRHASASTLATLVNNLRSEWHRLAARMGEISSTFEQLGISHAHAPARGRGPGRPAASMGSKAKPARRRKRKHFAQNADQFVLDTLKKGDLTAAQVNAAWKKAGRGGVSNNTLTKLTKEKQIKRQALKGERGSQYSLA